MAKTITDNPDGSPDLSIGGLFPQGQPSADSPLGLGALAQGVNTAQPGPYPAGTPLQNLYQSAPIPAQTTAATGTGGGAPPDNPYVWAVAQLNFMNLPVTTGNVNFLVSWAAAEGGHWHNTASYNPLNTTLRLDGSSTMSGGNTAGVQAYSSWQVGLQATADTLANYGEIMSALKSGNAMQANDAGQLATDFSRWSGGGYTRIALNAAYATTTRSGVGAGSGGAAGPAGTPAQTPASTTIGALSLAQAQQQYPELAWMLTIPDAAADIQTWAAQNYTPDEIAARLQGKAWYQRLGAPFFTWIAAQATNPSQAAQTFQEELAAVKQTFQQLGLQPSPQQLQTFAYQALAQDWTNHPELEQQAIASTVHPNKDGTFSVRNFTITSAGQLASTFIGPQGQPVQVNWQDFQKTLPTNYIGSGLVSQIGATKAGGGFTTENITPGAPVYALINGQLEQGFDVKALAPGTALYTLPNYVTGPTGQAQVASESHMAGSLTAAEQAFKAAAADYMVPVSDAAAAQLVQQALQSGTTDIATFAKTYFTAQAKSLYPSMAGAIDAGITPRAYTDPYRQVVAQLLGTSPDSINMSDPKYMRFVTNKDPKTGVPTAMSLYDAQQLVMSDPIYGYMKTQGAADRASALAQGIGEMFGKVAPTPAGFASVAAPRV